MGWQRIGQQPVGQAIENPGVPIGDDEEIRERGGCGRHLAQHGTIHEDTVYLVAVSLQDALDERPYAGRRRPKSPLVYTFAYLVHTVGVAALLGGVNGCRCRNPQDGINC